MTQARTVSDAEFFLRVNAAELANDSIHVTRPGFLDRLRYETPEDEQIAVLEGAIAMQRGRAGALLESAKRWRSKGDAEMARRNVASVKDIRHFIRTLAGQIDALVAKRDGRKEAA